ncbi:MAG: hypothetical protein M3367_04740 [Acidobacteriota bacterium]|nr:hypothetical protein [Acidobacteriota bacterium]
MKNKITFLMILMLAISSVSACSFKVANAASRTDSKTAEKENRNTESSAIVKNTTENVPSNLTGTYRYKSGTYNNTISVQQQGNNRLRVALYASYEYKVNGEWNANVGEAEGIVAFNGDTAVLVPEDREDCKIMMKFSGNKLIVKQESKSNCGFGLNAYAGGTYTKVNNKPDFSDSDEDSTSTRNSTASERNSKTERIRFAPGKSSTVVSGKLIGSEEIVYLVGARAGQTIKVKITEGGRTDGGGNNDAVFHIVAPDGSYPMGMAGELAELETGWRGKLKKSGDYKIVVGTIESEKVNFKMSVSIR